MRVIAGSRKGRPIQSVPGKGTRPTSDKVKETLFNLLGQPFFDGGTGLDLYAGTGGLGIEALSRGLDHCIFVDQHPQAIRVLKRNLHVLDLTSKGEVYRNDVHRALKALAKRQHAFHFIFMDPPYAKRTVEDHLVFIDQARLLDQDGTIVAEAGKVTQLPEQIGRLRRYKAHVQGQTCLHLYRY